MHPQFSDGSKAVVRAELERQHEVLRALARRADASASALLSPATDGGWRGPASWAFELALGAVRRDASHAIDAVRTAQRMTEAALYEVDNGV
ncbi:MAG TPA: hypothetical protein VIJ76_00575 [Galbitalea sp.]